jgi:hypothetical protein
MQFTRLLEDGVLPACFRALEEAATDVDNVYLIGRILGSDRQGGACQ